MPVPNDFRLSGALGGLVASQEYQAEQEKQNLANLLTQAQTAQQTQQTQQAQQLLPFLLQQREQENQIRAKEALAAQLGMQNVPLEQQLAGMQTQGKINSFDAEQELAGKERKGKSIGLDQANQLAGLRQIHTILQTQGPLAAASAAGQLGMNPEELMKDPAMIPRAIAMLENQAMRTPQHLGSMAEKELSGVMDIEKAKIGANATIRSAEIGAESRKYEADIKAQERAAKKDQIKSSDQLFGRYVDEYNSIAADPNATPEQKEMAYQKAESLRQSLVSIKRDPSVMFDPELSKLSTVAPNQTQPIKRIHGSASNPAPKGSGGAQILTPEQRAEIVRRLNESK